MKSVIISIRPKWCEKIASGEKTIEVRKNKPLLAEIGIDYAELMDGNVKLHGFKEKPPAEMLNADKEKAVVAFNGFREYMEVDKK